MEDYWGWKNSNTLNANGAPVIAVVVPSGAAVNSAGLIPQAPSILTNNNNIQTP